MPPDDSKPLAIGDVILPLIDGAYRIAGKTVIDYADGERRWHVIVTTPRAEEKVAEKLGELNAVTYVPKRRHWAAKPDRAGKMHKRVTPLLAGYVLVQLPARNPLFELVRAVGGVRRFVQADGGPAVVPDHLVADLEAREVAGEFDATKPTKRIRRDKSPIPEWISEGALLKVARGPFAAFVATVVEALSVDCVRAEVWMFGRTTPVQFSVEDLRA